MKFCPNCGNDLNGNEGFCGNCGNPVNLSSLPNKKELTSTEKFSNILSKLMKELKLKLCNFLNKYKKQFIIGISGLSVLLIALLLYGQLFGFEKLSWDKHYKSLDLKYVSQTNLKLGILFTNDKEIDKIKYKVTCGKLENKGLELVWDVSDSLGKCEITASYKLKKITKEFTVISPYMTTEELAIKNEIDLESDEDLDLDGLTNKQEKELNTNPLLFDSDVDGLNDYNEIYKFKTNPTNEDSDNDGLNDYDEIELGLNPLTKISKNDATSDGDRTLTYNYETEQVTMNITGKGNIASTHVEVTPNTKISSKEGLIDNLYTFYTDGEIKSAVVTISYSKEDIELYGLNEDNLSIYYYSEEDSTYEKIETTIDKENKTLTATLSHFSNYVIGDFNKVKEKVTNQILFILDNSWSMYTEEQYKEITGEEWNYSDEINGYDKNGIRFTLTSELVSQLINKDYEIGLSEFRYDYANALPIGSSEKTLKDNLNNMKGNFITNNEGTNITNALNKGIQEFSKDSDNKYIIILTDGQDSTLATNTTTIIENAISKNVKICSVGFGGGSYNVELSNISNGTGCQFYSSGDVTGLTELFENVSSELNDDLVDVDKDGKEDGIMLADSGFIVNRDGFSFGNYISNLSGGHCFGMATFAELYYVHKLPSRMDAKTINQITTINETQYNSYSYDLNNTYFSNEGNLFDYKLQTNALKYYFGFEYFGEQIPADLRDLKNNTLVYGDNYKNEIINSGFYDFYEEPSELSPEQQLEKWGVNYGNAENIQINEDKIQKNKDIKNDEKQLFNALYSFHISQYDLQYYSSGMDWDLWVRNKAESENIEYEGTAGFINVLKSRLKSQDAPVIISEYSGKNQLHAVNAISLVQDIENPNYYYIGVYDNNYPGEKRYVDIKCKKSECVTISNKYYKYGNQPIRITPSLENDLEYFQK